MSIPVIALDAMGGDFAPRHEVRAAVEAARAWPVRILLIGHRDRLQPLLREYGGSGLPIEVVHAEEVIGMDENPLIAIRRKRQASIVVAAQLLKAGICQAVVSAGNTGAVMAAMKFIVGTLPGVERPALAVVLPTRTGYVVLIDAGANVHVRPFHLKQFAIMGATYAQLILKVSNPRVGVLSIGEEDIKGNALTRGLHEIMREAPVHFIGNVEGKDIFTGAADVIVCDGFIGNVVLKASESLADMIGALLKEEIKKRPLAQLGYLLMKPAMHAFRRRVDYSEYGGAPLLGIRGLAIICHGRSSPKAIRNALRVAKEFTEARMNEAIQARIAADIQSAHVQEKRSHG